MMQYAISNMGTVQLILNRYLYSLVYRYQDRRRQWKCVDGRGRHTGNCHAKVVTLDNVVVRRMGAHTHPFHDRKILQKVMAGRVYAALTEAEAHVRSKPNTGDTSAPTNINK